MKKWNPYIPPLNKEKGKWKQTFRLALVLILLGIFLVLNDWGFDFRMSFQLKSLPIEKDIPAEPALRTLYLEDSSVRYRDRTT